MSAENSREDCDVTEAGTLEYTGPRKLPEVAIGTYTDVGVLTVQITIYQVCKL